LNRILVWQLAIRYLRGKRTANIVPILSRISMVAICVSSAAMIIIFSVSNGIVSLVKNNYKAFYPDIRISAARGKFFHIDSAKVAALRGIHGVTALSISIEDNAFAINQDQQKVITVKGIDAQFTSVNDIGTYLVAGEAHVSADTPSAILGARIINELGSSTNALSNIVVNYPDPTITDPSADPLSALRSLSLHPAGVFKIDDNFDNKYMLAPLALVQGLFHQQGNCSAIELKTTSPDVKADIQQLFGSNYKVETRYEQNSTLYSVMGFEKWAIYAILLLVLLIASFNMVGALAMLVMEKQKDIGILKAMGAGSAAIRSVFLAEGVLWSLLGGVTGIVIGIGVCLLQQRFHFVRMGDSFTVDAYPVEIQGRDILLDFFTIITVGILAAWYPAMRANKTIDLSLKST
jgi:lipoprotein-releasing system permease protein